MGCLGADTVCYRSLHSSSPSTSALHIDLNFLAYYSSVCRWTYLAPPLSIGCSLRDYQVVLSDSLDSFFLSLICSVIDAPGYAGCIYVLPNRWIYVDFILVIITESGERLSQNLEVKMINCWNIVCLGMLLRKTLSGSVIFISVLWRRLAKLTVKGYALMSSALRVMYHDGESSGIIVCIR